MMMEDRSVSRRHDDHQKNTSPQHRHDTPPTHHVIQSGDGNQLRETHAESVHSPGLHRSSAPINTVSSPGQHHLIALHTGPEPCVSPAYRPGSLTRDSGYNTEVSPATTCSPAVATPPRLDHFIFEDLETADIDRSRSEEAVASVSSSSLQTMRQRASTEPTLGVSAFSSFSPTEEDTPQPSSSQRPRLSLYERRNSKPTPTLRLSPDMQDTSSDSTCTPVMSADTDNDPLRLSSQALKKRGRLTRGHFDESGNFIGSLHSSSNESDDEEEVFHTQGINAQRWGTKQRGLFRKDSFSLRNRFASSDSDEEADKTGRRKASQQRDIDNSGLSRNVQITSQTLPSASALEHDADHVLNLHGTEDEELGACGGTSSVDWDIFQHSSSSSRAGSQGFDPCPSTVEDSHNSSFSHHQGLLLTSPFSESSDGQVFNFDCLPHQLQASLNPGHRSAGPYTTLNIPSPALSRRPSPHDEGFSCPVSPRSNQLVSKPPVSPALKKRSRKVATTLQPSLTFPSVPSSDIAIPGGFRLPCLRMQRGQTVSTQTPHRTCFMIQQILDTPVPLPNEARGTAAGRLRRITDMGVPLPPSPVPLPDIIPLGRDRSLSAPDLQALARQRARAAGRQVGRELRRLSDEFNATYGRSLSPVHEEHHYSASYPGMATTMVRAGVTHMATFLRETFGRPRGSSVDGEDVFEDMPD